MSQDDLWLEYRLRRIVFQNGAEIGFVRARMRYHEDGHRILIERIDAPFVEIDSILGKIVGPDRYLPELKEIYYDMKVDGYPLLKFVHKLKRGTGVTLLPPVRGSSTLYFGQADKESMFTKEWTLRDVSEGAIDSDKHVWQFHGYLHDD